MYNNLSLYTNPSFVQGAYCQINCPRDLFPAHTALLTSPLPLTLNGSQYIQVPHNRHPSFSGNVTFFAEINQTAGTQGYLIFYGTSTTRPNFSIFLDSRTSPNTILTLAYISRDDNLVTTISLEIPSVAGGEHCLTIIFQRTLSVYVDNILAVGARPTLPDLDLTSGVSQCTCIIMKA